MRAIELPADTSWLGPLERRHLGHLTHPKRRVDWLLGRWAAKQAILQMPEAGLSCEDARRLEIMPDDNGAPRLKLAGRPLALALSLSHREGAGLAAVSVRGDVGCDLEWLEERSEAFIQDYFTRPERQWIDVADPDRRALMANGFWSAKESLTKMLGKGLTVDTRSILVESFVADDARCWQPLRIRYQPDGRCFSGWWRQQDNWILTVVTETETGPPTGC